VDVGAYNAYYALTFAKLTHAQVLSYEPDPDAVARSRRNLALNPGLSPLIAIRTVAVGARDDGASVTLDAELTPRAHERGLAPWLLKVDVEGAEFDVLRGAAGFLAAARPHVMVETHSAGLEAACGDALLGHGYSPRVVTQRRLFRQDRSWPPGTPRHNRWLVAVGRRLPGSTSA
jgi:Methyltransferase FkbM domain